MKTSAIILPFLLAPTALAWNPFSRSKGKKKADMKAQEVAEIPRFSLEDIKYWQTKIKSDAESLGIEDQYLKHYLSGEFSGKGSCPDSLSDATIDFAFAIAKPPPPPPPSKNSKNKNGGEEPSFLGRSISDFTDLFYLFVINNNDCGWIQVRTFAKEADRKTGNMVYLPQHPRHVDVRVPIYQTRLPEPVSLEALKISPDEALNIAMHEHPSLKMGVDAIHLSSDSDLDEKKPLLYSIKGKSDNTETGKQDIRVRVHATDGSLGRTMIW